MTSVAARGARRWRVRVGGRLAPLLLAVALASAAARAVLAALQADYGMPDAMCGVQPGPASGYQSAAERIWLRHGAVIRAILRDTTIEAFEGCLAGDPSQAGPCGLTGQLLVRISPPDSDGGACPIPGYAPSKR